MGRACLFSVALRRKDRVRNAYPDYPEYPEYPVARLNRLNTLNPPTDRRAALRENLNEESKLKGIVRKPGFCYCGSVTQIPMDEDRVKGKGL